MKRLISFLIVVATIISHAPAISFAQDTDAQKADVNPVGTTKDNPFVFSDTNNVFMIEAEDYPFPSINYKVVSDEKASGGKAITRNGYLLKDEYKYNVPGDLVHYRLWVKSEDVAAIKLYGRARLSENTSAKYATSSYNEKTDDRSFSVDAEVGDYAWGAMDSFELPPGEVVPINILFYSDKTRFDKFIISNDLLYTPQGIEGTYKEFILGEDTTNYERLRYPLPPFSPRKDRPRVYMNKDTLVKIRKNLDHPENAPVYAQVLKNAVTTPKSWSATAISKYVWANAFLWQLNGDKEAGQKAVDAIFNSFTAETNSSVTRATKAAMNERSYHMFMLAIVYDWCYDFLDDNKKKTIIGKMLYYSSQQEYPYPPTVNGRNNGHESESDIFLGQFSCAIAVYEDFPEMYNIVGGKIFEQMLSTRNFYYEMKNHAQGTHYNSARMTCEANFAVLLQNGVAKGLISEGADDAMLDNVFSMRPDSQLAIKGDDSQNGVSRTAYVGSAVSYFVWGNLTKNPYLRDTFFRYHPNNSFSYTATSLNHIQWLIVNDPAIGRKSYKEYPNVIYLGDKAGIMHCRTSWELGDEDYSNQLYVRLNMETHHAKGHDHLDTGHFDIYYKGSLALDSGHYPSFGHQHHKNYAARGIAHNIMLLYDPDEKMYHNGYYVANDGGQEYKYAMGGTLEKMKTEGVIAETLNADYGDDMKNPSFAYLKSDLTKAYWEGKMEHYTRSFVYLNFFDETYPGALIVFDRMISKKPELKKTWLLHTQQEPIINKENAMVIADKTEEGDNGRLINQTLYPKKENLIIDKIGGEGYEYWVDGKNYQNTDGSKVHPQEHKDYGEWRLEVSPKERVAEDYILNVLHVTEANDEIIPLKAELIETKNYLGAKIKDRVAFFSKNEGRGSEDITFTLTGEENYEILFTDVSEGQWIIYKNGKEYDRQIATENGGDFKFNGTKGEYTLKKNNRSPLTFKRDMNYRNHLTPLGDKYDYFRVNNLYYDFEYLKEDGKIFINAIKISDILNSSASVNNDKLIIKGKFKDSEFNKDSEYVRVKDGIWYIDIDSLEDILYLKYTNPVPHVYHLSGGLSLKEYNFINNDGVAHVISAKVPEENYDPSYPAEYTVDTESGTLWQTDVIGNTITYELDGLYRIDSVNIVWSKKGRGHSMMVETSKDGEEWVLVYDDITEPAESTTKAVLTEFEPSVAKFVRITGMGNTEGSAWFGIYQLTFPAEGKYDEIVKEETEEENETDENTSDTEDAILNEEEEEDEEDEEDEEEAEGGLV